MINGSSLQLKQIFDKFMIAKRWGYIALYDNKDYSIPHIYASSILISHGNFIKYE